jgi:hypothetical protein
MPTSDRKLLYSNHNSSLNSSLYASTGDFKEKNLQSLGIDNGSVANNYASYLIANKRYSNS